MQAAVGFKIGVYIAGKQKISSKIKKFQGHAKHEKKRKQIPTISFVAIPATPPSSRYRTSLAEKPGKISTPISSACFPSHCTSLEWISTAPHSKVPSIGR
jgi:hypothetical protein